MSVLISQHYGQTYRYGSTRIPFNKYAKLFWTYMNQTVGLIHSACWKLLIFLSNMGVHIKKQCFFLTRSLYFGSPICQGCFFAEVSNLLFVSLLVCQYCIWFQRVHVFPSGPLSAIRKPLQSSLHFKTQHPRRIAMVCISYLPCM